MPYQRRERLAIKFLRKRKENNMCFFGKKKKQINILQNEIVSLRVSHELLNKKADCQFDYWSRQVNQDLGALFKIVSNLFDMKQVKLGIYEESEQRRGLVEMGYRFLVSHNNTEYWVKDKEKSFVCL